MFPCHNGRYSGYKFFLQAACLALIIQALFASVPFVLGGENGASGPDKLMINDGGKSNPARYNGLGHSSVATTTQRALYNLKSVMAEMNGWNYYTRNDNGEGRHDKMTKTRKLINDNTADIAPTSSPTLSSAMETLTESPENETLEAASLLQSTADTSSTTLHVSFETTSTFDSAQSTPLSDILLPTATLSIAQSESPVASLMAEQAETASVNSSSVDLGAIDGNTAMLVSDQIASTFTTSTTIETPIDPKRTRFRSCIYGCTTSVVRASVDDDPESTVTSTVVLLPVHTPCSLYSCPNRGSCVKSTVTFKTSYHISKITPPDITMTVYESAVTTTIFNDDDDSGKNTSAEWMHGKEFSGTIKVKNIPFIANTALHPFFPQTSTVTITELSCPTAMPNATPQENSSNNAGLIAASAVTRVLPLSADAVCTTFIMCNPAQFACPAKVTDIAHMASIVHNQIGCDGASCTSGRDGETAAGTPEPLPSGESSVTPSADGEGDLSLKDGIMAANVKATPSSAKASAAAGASAAGPDRHQVLLLAVSMTLLGLLTGNIL